MAVARSLKVIGSRWRTRRKPAEPARPASRFPAMSSSSLQRLPVTTTVSSPTAVPSRAALTMVVQPPMALTSSSSQIRAWGVSRSAGRVSSRPRVKVRRRSRAAIPSQGTWITWGFASVRVLQISSSLTDPHWTDKTTEAGGFGALWITEIGGFPKDEVTEGGGYLPSEVTEGAGYGLATAKAPVKGPHYRSREESGHPRWSSAAGARAPYPSRSALLGCRFVSEKRDPRSELMCPDALLKDD